MKRLFNELLRIWVRISLHVYFGEIQVKGRQHIPRDQPLIIVANHQNALLDALLIATELGLKPHFLARASIFKNPWIASLLSLLQLIPVFRIRDGFQNLSRNDETFQRCQHILARRESILLFPEGNHSLQRHLRPLSKGFTRIAFGTLQNHPDLPLYLLPVGINYGAHQYAGSKVSLQVGKAIPVAEADFDAQALKEQVATSLKALTVQIPATAYEISLQKYLKGQVDLSDPAAFQAGLTFPAHRVIHGRPIIHLLYFPLLLIWKFLKPSIKDPVFYGTVKFLIGFLGVPLYFILITLIFCVVGLPLLGSTVVIGLAIVLYVFRHSVKQA